MHNTFAKLKFIYSLAVIISTILALGLIRINLVQTSTESINQFALSNRSEIANADTYELATKLNALLASENITCISGRYKDKEFISYQRGYCKSSLLVSESIYNSPSNSDLEIKLSFKIPTYLLFSTLSFILGEIILFLYLLRVNQQRILLDEKVKKIALNISKQVSHDIRSPLSTLAMVVDALKEIPEEKKVLIINAAQRINDIANDLLKKSKERENENADYLHLTEDDFSYGKLQIVSVAQVIEEIFHEKKIQIENKPNIQMQADYQNSDEALVKVKKSDLSRIISNIINNSIESLATKEGSIIVAVRVYSETVTISIQDDGCGIPQDILEKLGHVEGVSHGKNFDESGSGSGLGIYQAFQLIKSWKGKIEISSRVDVGTLFCIHLPRAN